MKKIHLFCLGITLLLMSAVAHAQGKYVMHVASKYGETTFDTEIVDSVYFLYASNLWVTRCSTGGSVI